MRTYRATGRSGKRRGSRSRPSKGSSVEFLTTTGLPCRMLSLEASEARNVHRSTIHCSSLDADMPAAVSQDMHHV